MYTVSMQMSGSNSSIQNSARVHSSNIILRYICRVPVPSACLLVITAACMYVLGVCALGACSRGVQKTSRSFLLQLGVCAFSKKTQLVKRYPMDAGDGENFRL